MIRPRYQQINNSLVCRAAQKHWFVKSLHLQPESYLTEYENTKLVLPLQVMWQEI